MHLYSEGGDRGPSSESRGVTELPTAAPARRRTPSLPTPASRCQHEAPPRGPCAAWGTSAAARAIEEGPGVCLPGPPMAWGQRLSGPPALSSSEEPSASPAAPLSTKRRVLSQSALRSHRPVARPVAVGLSRCVWAGAVVLGGSTDQRGSTGAGVPPGLGGSAAVRVMRTEWPAAVCLGVHWGRGAVGA